ncbi:MAG: InlB B-repeat-containing protein [Treponema sp.]|nr:InlB B-repeat-containing protein [Treponema sp.]
MKKLSGTVISAVSLLFLVFTIMACANSISPDSNNTGSDWTVRFVYNNGSQDTTVTAPDGYPVTQPNTPQNGALYFIGWFASENTGFPWNFNSPVNSNLTLTARWQTSNDYVIKDKSVFPITKTYMDPVNPWIASGGAFYVNADFYNKIKLAPEGSFVRLVIDGDGLAPNTALGWIAGNTVPFAVPASGYIDIAMDQIADDKGMWGGVIAPSYWNNDSKDPKITSIELHIPQAIYQPIMFSPADIGTVMIPGAKVWPKFVILVNYDDDVTNKDVTIQSSNSSVIAAYADNDEYGIPTGLIVLQAMAAGTSNITLTSVANPLIQGTIAVQVNSPVPVPDSAAYIKSTDLALPDGGDNGLDRWLPESFVDTVRQAVTSYGGDHVFVVFNMDGTDFTNGDEITYFGFGGAPYSVTYSLFKTADNKTTLSGTQVMLVIDDNSLGSIVTGVDGDGNPVTIKTTWLDGYDKVVSAELWIPR